ncbi:MULTISPECIES: OmpA family protein [Romboutsia]|uniref:OmpA protein n=1 Tax=Romboutsia hominis TaxID=1507512 RepID=A0A2P2BV13_9FIRM|nr:MULTISPECIES: OmpA family protein [Romboutsia]MCH1960196.1 OmpA family protein [Romboutsia hominis]MCH1969369.1 OmpA family protein [Romboutsia hominis]MDB8791988.1 OmpA family protein [Romboutsia sp. 1001216sp1]MDB8794113.1 OmpA family protein [Romboutsia sp. 1001216sp1]MDB8796341.1 OmpA family protein [Romboutsia sp. 1001216sp1]
MINKYRRTINKEFEKSSFWPTFTDMIATVLMVIMLILFSSESITGSVEKDLAKSINDSVKNTLKDNGLNVLIDEKSGLVTFGESTLFDVDSYELKQEAKEMLKIFIPRYVEALYSNYEGNISKIVIKGHTDDVGSYLYNLDLSQKRAYSVATFIVGEEIGDYKYKDKVLKDIEAIGRSEAELIKNTDGTINKDASRRVELMYEIDVD